MSPPEMRRGRPATNGAPPNTDNIDHRHSADIATNSNAHNDTALPVVAALAYPPAGRRSLWLLLVPRCPLCLGYAHVHRATTPAVEVRESGCRRGSYRLVPGVVA